MGEARVNIQEPIRSLRGLRCVASDSHSQLGVCDCQRFGKCIAASGFRCIDMDRPFPAGRIRRLYDGIFNASESMVQHRLEVAKYLYARRLKLSEPVFGTT
jgi:hypothetical protein